MSSEVIALNSRFLRIPSTFLSEPSDESAESEFYESPIDVGLSSRIQFTRPAPPDSSVDCSPNVSRTQPLIQSALLRQAKVYCQQCNRHNFAALSARPAALGLFASLFKLMQALTCCRGESDWLKTEETVVACGSCFVTILVIR